MIHNKPFILLICCLLICPHLMMAEGRQTDLFNFSWKFHLGNVNASSIVTI